MKVRTTFQRSGGSGREAWWEFVEDAANTELFVGRNETVISVRSLHLRSQMEMRTNPHRASLRVLVRACQVTQRTCLGTCLDPAHLAGTTTFSPGSPGWSGPGGPLCPSLVVPGTLAQAEGTVLIVDYV